jgi:tetratricopeptide (TPR) repeat protein
MTNKANKNEFSTNHEKLSAFLNKYFKIIVLTVTFFVFLTVFVIGGVLFREYKVTNELKAYQSIAQDFESELMNISKKYQSESGQEKEVDSDAMERERDSAVKGYADKLIALTEKSHWGYVADNGYFIAGGLYFTIKDYKQALMYYTKAGKTVDNDVLELLSMQQAAVCDEWLNKNDDALKIYQELEKKYKKTDSLDRIFYDLGRMYQIKGNTDTAKDYFTKVIKNYSSSVFAKKSQERILLLGSK